MKSDHIVNSFDKDIKSLTKSIILMGDKVLNLIQISENSIENPSSANWLEAKKQDQEINDMEMQIQQDAITILALRQPVAIDLRLVASSIKITGLLERMGDRAKNIVKKIQTQHVSFDKNILKDIKKMNLIVRDMVSKTIDNITNYSKTTTQDTLQADHKVSRYYGEIFNKIVKNHEKKPLDPKEFISSISIIKNYERIGDYAIKLSKIMHYIAKGEDYSSE
jgi:phosphate transport system protein